MRTDIAFRNKMQTPSSKEQMTVRPHSVPFSTNAHFANLSEKERYHKIQGEFNKVKAYIELHLSE